MRRHFEDNGKSRQHLSVVPASCLCTTQPDKVLVPAGHPKEKELSSTLDNTWEFTS